MQRCNCFSNFLVQDIDANYFPIEIIPFWFQSNMARGNGYTWLLLHSTVFFLSSSLQHNHNTRSIDDTLATAMRTKWIVEIVAQAYYTHFSQTMECFVLYDRGKQFWRFLFCNIEFLFIHFSARKIRENQNLKNWIIKVSRNRKKHLNK